MLCVCVYSFVVEGAVCDFAADHRYRFLCGPEGSLDAHGCIARNCCFDDSVGYASGTPYCFLPKALVRTACRGMS